MTTDKFKNTYINTSGLSVDKLNNLAKKYSKVTGYPLEEIFPSSDYWYFITTVNDIHGDPLYDQITFTDTLVDIRDYESLTEITEKDLDDYLDSQNNSEQPIYPDFDFKINLTEMSDEEKEVAKEWLKQTARSRELSYKVLSEDDCHDHYWVVEDHGCMTALYENDKEYYSNEPTPELFLTFSKPAVTSWECVENKSEKVLQLETEIAKLASQLEELQKQLNNINN